MEERHGEHIGDHLCSIGVIGWSTSHRTICIGLDGGPGLDKRVDTYAPSTGFVGQFDRSR